MAHKILLIEDDTEVVQLLSTYLERHRFQVFACSSPEEARHALRTQNISLIILDIMLPEMSGLDFCREVRRFSSVPIIFVTALGQVTDRIVGLELGADDYLVKPFDPRELLARLKSVLRRTDGFRSSHLMTFEGLDINLHERSVRQDGSLVDLSSSEYEALLALIEKTGQVVSRDRLLEHLRGADTDAFNRAIDTTISRLRTKLKDDAQKPRFIKTVWGSGYTFVGVRREI